MANDRKNDRSDSRKRVIEVLSDRGRRVWVLDDEERNGHKFSVSGWATRKGLVILLEIYEDGVCVGWDLFKPLTESILVEETFTALDNFLKEY